ncbi:hypothetical protein ACHAXA_011301 [Cyclostephanos tholiformis]|uniref:Uncharacterized protein n=1 Tax=Cyclostephanos tholiformis TaxID=382380 RepID=A0ABD3RW99_9STRA
MTLRQNRTDFVRDQFDVVGVERGGSSPMAMINTAPSSMSSNDVGLDMMSQQPCPPMSSPQNESSSSIGGSWNPLPFADSADLESGRFLEQLRKVISSTSSKCTNPSFINSNLVFENGDLTNTNPKLHFNGMESKSSINSANYYILSMTNAELCAAMGSFLNSPNASETSAQAFGALLMN